MNKSLNKSKWPYLLLLAVCMVAASINPKTTSKSNSGVPLMVNVQVEHQPKTLTPYSDWLVQSIALEVEP